MFTKSSGWRMRLEGDKIDRTKSEGVLRKSPGPFGVEFWMYDMGGGK